MSTAPNHTVYINNLNEKIKKDGKFMKIAILFVIRYVEHFEFTKIYRLMVSTEN